MTRWRFLCGLFVLARFTACAQTEFEVASVKPAAASTGNNLRVSMNLDKGRLTLSNVSLRNIVTRAYEIKDPQFMGPEWMATERYDVIAKLPEGAPKEKVPVMLRALLADRFKMTIHKESKVMPVYALVAAKSGPKLKEAEAESGLRMSFGPKGREMTGSVTLERLADALSNSMDRPVLDMTGLKGIYEIDLKWSPDDSERGPVKMAGPGPGPGGRPEGGEGKSNDSADGPTIFTALQEKMGLKLESRKSPVDMIVVDHAEKVPTEN